MWIPEQPVRLVFYDRNVDDYLNQFTISSRHVVENISSEEFYFVDHFVWELFRVTGNIHNIQWYSTCCWSEMCRQTLWWVDIVWMLKASAGTFYTHQFETWRFNNVYNVYLSFSLDFGPLNLFFWEEGNEKVFKRLFKILLTAWSFWYNLRIPFNSH